MQNQSFQNRAKPKYSPEPKKTDEFSEELASQVAESEPEKAEEAESPAAPVLKGAELTNIERPSGMRARAQHHLDAYTAKLRRTPHGGAGQRTCEVVISVCRDILGEAND